MLFERSRFTGSWRFALYPEAGTKPNIALGTFCADGAFMTSPPSVEEFPPHPSGVVQVSSGHGAWEPSSDGAAAVTFVAQASGSDGSFVGLGTVDARFEVGPDGDSLQGTYDFAIADTEGAIFATEHGTLRGSRIVVRAPVPASR